MSSHKTSLDWRVHLSARQLQALLDDPPLASHPGQAPWGYYLALAGDQLGYFSWFSSQELMLQHLVHIEMWHAPLSVPERSDYETKATLLQQAADQWLADRSTEIYARFNQEIQGVSLKWLGHWQDLQTPPQTAQADDPAQLFMSQLLAAYSKEASTAPEADPEAFADFLESYGL